MKNILFLLLTSALLMGACRTIKSSDFHTNQAIPNKLPTLGLLVHERSFLEAFDHEYFNEWAFYTEPDPWLEYQTTDQALEDVFHLLRNELADNLSQSASATFGHARFKLLRYDRHNPGWGWIIPSVGTLMVANLLGMPYANIQSKIEMQMEIVDANGNILNQYVAKGSGKAKVAMYYGYPTSQVIRKANLLAIKDAMSKIKAQLATDAATLDASLKAAGELKKLGK